MEEEDGWHALGRGFLDFFFLSARASGLGLGSGSGLVCFFSVGWDGLASDRVNYGNGETGHGRNGGVERVSIYHCHCHCHGCWGISHNFVVSWGLIGRLT